MSPYPHRHAGSSTPMRQPEGYREPPREYQRRPSWQRQQPSPQYQQPQPQPQHQQLQHYQQPQYRQSPPQVQAPVPEPGKSSIPPLTTLAPAIFVELKGEELTDPFTPPSNRLQRIEAKLDSLTVHSKKVRDNCLGLYRQECLRHVENTHLWERENREHVFEDAQRMAADSDGRRKRGLDLLMANMEYGFDSNVLGHTPPMLDEIEQMREAQAQTQAETPPTGPQHPFSRQSLVRDIERTINKGLVDLDNFDNHVEGIRQRYRELYEREVARDREFDF